MKTLLFLALLLLTGCVPDYPRATPLPADFKVGDRVYLDMKYMNGEVTILEISPDRTLLRIHPLRIREGAFSVDDSNWSRSPTLEFGDRGIWHLENRPQP